MSKIVAFILPFSDNVPSSENLCLFQTYQTLGLETFQYALDTTHLATFVKTLDNPKISVVEYPN